MSAYVRAGGGHPSDIVNVVLSLLRMQPPSTRDSPGLCVTTTLTADDKVTLEAVLQLGVALFMVLLVLFSLGIGRCLSRIRRSNSNLKFSRNFSDGYMGVSLHPLSIPLLDRAEVGGSEDMHAVEDLQHTSTSRQRGSDDAVWPLRRRLILAGAIFGLTAYATVTSAVVKMLHCVWVPGTPPSERRLFIRGSVTCDYFGWQRRTL
jgi:hypothetical protein